MVLTTINETLMESIWEKGTKWKILLASILAPFTGVNRPNQFSLPEIIAIFTLTNLLTNTAQNITKHVCLLAFVVVKFICRLTMSI